MGMGGGEGEGGGDALCLETYGKHFLGFHDVPNTVMFDLVQTVQAEWQLGIHGISQGVSSVISDYSQVRITSEN